MIDVKQAANKAVSYVADLLGPANVLEPRIEEVELSDDSEYWLITVGFFPPMKLGSLISSAPSGKREYKQVQIRASDGNIKAMRIRTT